MEEGRRTGKGKAKENRIGKEEWRKEEGIGGWMDGVEVRDLEDW